MVGLLAWVGLLLLALLAGGVVMVLELAAPRLAAPYVGTTALTWTVVIGTFLLGLAAGNTLGGRLADRARRATLPLLLLLSAAAAWLTPPLHDAAMALTRGWVHGLRVAIGIPLAFLPLALLLGTVTPVLARDLLGMDRRARPGRRLGAVAAAGAAGSVAGTFLAGFVLVPAMGTRALFAAAAALLAASAVVSLPLALLTAQRRPAPRVRDAAPPPRGWTALAVLAGAAILGVEIAAGRMVSDHLGASIYAWTSVIGVVLTGLTVGAWIGGFLADRYAARPLLRLLFLLASLTVVYSLWGGAILKAAEKMAEEEAWEWGWTTLGATTLAFLLPSIALGSLSPVVIRAALADPRGDGRTVGRLYAAGTLGAVVATLLVGYWVLPWLGYERVLVLVAFLLAAASGLLRGRQPYAWHVLLVLLALLIHSDLGPAPEVGRWLRLRDEYPPSARTDSRYFRIRVRPDDDRWVRLEEEPQTREIFDQPLLDAAWWDADRGRLGWDLKRGEMTIPQQALLRIAMRNSGDRRQVGRLRLLTKHGHVYLQLDRLIHGYVDLQDPLWLGYEYEHLYAAVVEQAWPVDRPARCLFIGGGAFAFQRHLLARHGDDLSCTTAEIDPEVTRTAYEHLALERDPRHLIVHDDARTFVEGLDPEEARFDFVFGDAFNDLAVPFHLTTREFAEALEARMTKDGVYLLNVIDTYDSGLFLGAMLGTLQSVFDHVTMLSISPRTDSCRDTFVLVASNRRLDVNTLTLGPGEFQAVIVYDGFEMRELKGRVDGLVLTDDRAPVENLLAPVVRERSK